jgi:hypothetical protein
MRSGKGSAGHRATVKATRKRAQSGDHPEIGFTKSVWSGRASVWALHGRGRSIFGMDLIAVALALLAFLALYGLIELVDRI